MHVTIIANSFQEDYIEHLVNHLVFKVNRVDLIGSSKYESRKINEKVRFYNLRGDDHLNVGFVKKACRTFKYYYKLMGYLNKTNASIIHIQWLRFYLLEGVLLHLYIKLLNKKVIYTVHDVLPRLQETTINRLKFKFIYKMPDRLIAHTPYIKKRLIKEFSIQEHKIFVIVHGVYQRPKKENITQWAARDYFGLSQSATVLLFFGIIAKYKGFDLLLKSIERLGMGHNFQVLAAGRVNSDYQIEFQNLIDVHNVNVKAVLRFIEDEEIEYCFKAANITVLPYREASQSGVLFMSYAYGKPVIAPDLGGFPDDIIPHKTGYLFEPENIESLSRSLREFEAEWKGATAEKNEAIENFANSNYSWDKSCEQLVTVYES